MKSLVRLIQAREGVSGTEALMKYRSGVFNRVTALHRTLVETGCRSASRASSSDYPRARHGVKPA
jgi:hypothetical protein